MNKRSCKAYISGAITNNPNYLEQFAKAEARLMQEYISVYSPATCKVNILHQNTLKNNADLLWELCMRNCITHLMTCQVIVMLPGWKASKGAKIEHDLAKVLGLEMVYVSNWWMNG